MATDLPLHGIRVVDVSRVLAGPFATMLLGDLGADVVKVEPPGGDETRDWGPPWWGDPSERRSAYFAAVNRNKRGIVLDLRAADGRAALDRLLTDADLLVHNYRPATAARLGLGTDALRARHPTLVVASVGGFPPPHADRPAYDLLAQAVSGLMAITGEPSGPPAKVGVALLDLLAGVECALAALAALLARRDRPTDGRAVEIPLVESGVTALVNVLGNHLATGSEPRRQGNAHANIVPYQAFEARDGHLVVAAGNDAQFARLLDVLGLDDSAGRYATNPARVAARDELTVWLGAAIGDRDRAELLAALEAADVPAGPVNRVSEAVAMMGEGWVEEIDGMRLAPSPIHLDGARVPLRLPPPRLGEHTKAVLAELGMAQ